ncbi:hypothetical protein B0I35DRAFT_442997 [Stachybotrys elegans]|uniref:Uncharacterized protein n=1 Tax=Stachybotrys elegans TaxID=80388 RepID=A0A8K0WMP0_9HYPO|nr:hypothetical protein B0I35DRAFT_442997 [Stachybotrys elegans]
MMERLDLVVIGAGWYGLAAAKQYHCLHPEQSIAILDSAGSVGGTWGAERLYPGLKTNNLHGTFEYPDFPMDPSQFNARPEAHIPGQTIYEYLNAYAKHFGIFSSIRLYTKTLSATHQPEGGWVLRVESQQHSHSNANSTGSEIFATRLIVATGLTSEPFMPHINGQEEFGRPIFHPRDFKTAATAFDPSNRVTVFGGSKFAWDAVYEYATHGIHVDWVIRATGHGPCWVAPSFVTSFKKWIEELVNTRFVHWFSPCIWGQDSGYHAIKSFWHGTAIGRAVVNAFWNILGSDTIQLMGFDDHPETKKLKPTSEAMFNGSTFSIYTYDTDFLELVRNGLVRVHLADISHLSEGRVHLLDNNKTVLTSDGMVCVTGWKHKPSIQFLPEGIERSIGLCYAPSKPGEYRPGDQGLAGQVKLINKADAEILERFPRLKVPMKLNPHYLPLTDTRAFDADKTDTSVPVAPQTPMMLYRFTVPGTADLLRTKDLAFAGALMNFSTATCAHIQGLWISAYFDGKLDRDPSQAAYVEEDEKEASEDGMTMDQVHYETVLHNRFGKWRYPSGHGRLRPDFVFEAVPFFDMLMADLGLRVHRKNGWFNEMTSPYGPNDYRAINEEWKAKYDQEV